MAWAKSNTSGQSKNHIALPGVLERLAGGDALGRVQRQEAVQQVEAGVAQAPARVQGGGRRELGAQQVVRLLRKLDLRWRPFRV